MRKIISLIMVLAMLLTALPVYAWAAPDPMAASGTCGDNLTWVYDEGTRTLTISGTGPMYDSPEFNPLMTPCQALNVIVEEGVTSIGSMAFTYSAVTNIRLPASLTYISPSAFFYCYYLNYVEFLGNAPTISDNAFWETETTVFYPADNPTWTEAVGKHYEGTLTWVPGICNGRHSAVSIPATPVQCIVDGLTEGIYCSACGMVLREQFPVLAQGHSYENGLCVKCGKGVETYTGTYGENLTWVYTTDGSLRISGSGRMHDLANGGETTPWDAYRPYITNITIDSGVTSVGNFAFLSCENLLTAALPQGLEAIGSGAFSDCRKLEAISLPDTLKEIGPGAFFRCASLKTIRIPGGVTKIPGQMVCECTGLTQIEILGSITQIGEGAFRDCVSLSNITIPNSVLAIGRQAFCNCDSFTEMVFPRNVRDLEHFVLDGCDNLKRVVLPAKLETMGQRLFAGSQIEQIEIPAGVVKIDFSSLAGCHKLGRVTFKGNAPAFAGSAFDNQMTLTAYYPSNDPTWTADALQNYGGNVTWVPYEKTDAEETPHIHTEVIDPAVAPTCNRSGLTEGKHCASCYEILTEQKYVAPLGHDFAAGTCLRCGAEEGAATVASGTMLYYDGSPSDVHWTLDDTGKLTIFGSGDMQDYRPWDHTAVRTVEIREGITGIGSDCFSGHKELTSIHIAGTVTKIGSRAFEFDSNLKEIILPLGLTSIDCGAFYGCASLEEIVIPASVTLMARDRHVGCNSTFGRCSSLRKIKFEGHAPAFDCQTDGRRLFDETFTAVYYPAKDPTWTAEVMQSFGGSIKWIPYEKTVAEELADLVYTGTSPEEIRDTVQKIDTQTLQAQMAADTTNSGVVASLAALEAAAGGGAAVAVENPSIGLAAEDISVVGANLNGNGNVTLVVGQPEGNNSVSGEYDSAITVYFSMDLSNVEDTENLAVPVKITLPIPETMNPENVVILHYHANGTQETLYPAIGEEDGKNFASIVLTSFSDFAMTQLSDQEIENPEAGTTAMYRLFNPNSGEHFYTGSIVERNNLIQAGWSYENVSWNAPVRSGDPVYRLYNPNSGDHHYTMSEEERDMLVGYGWQYEGVAWNSASPDLQPLYRLYNPNADCGSHHYTGSTEERDYLVSLGWIYEGIGWFGIP